MLLESMTSIIKNLNNQATKSTKAILNMQSFYLKNSEQ